MKKPFIIAEIAQGYEGSEKLVDLYVKAVSFAGADAIKFQIFYADELALPDYKHYGLFKNLELPFSIWRKAVIKAHKNNLEFYSDVFGVKSLKNMEKIEIDGYKIHSTDINNISLLKEVAKTQKKIFLSTGGCNLKEIDRAVDIFKKSNLTLMYGFQSEPTKLKDNNLNKIRVLKERYKKPIGFQDHNKGGEDFSFYLSFIALGLGVDVLEKHFTLSRIAKIEDSISALTAEEFARWAKEIKKAYLSLGEHNWQLTEKEIEYKLKIRRAVCSAKEIKRGEMITEKALDFKRADNRDAFFDLNKVIGRKARKTIPKNVVIKRVYLR